MQKSASVTSAAPTLSMSMSQLMPFHLSAKLTRGEEILFGQPINQGDATHGLRIDLMYGDVLVSCSYFMGPDGRPHGVVEWSEGDYPPGYHHGQNMRSLVETFTGHHLCTGDLSESFDDPTSFDFGIIDAAVAKTMYDRYFKSKTAVAA